MILTIKGINTITSIDTAVIIAVEAGSFGVRVHLSGGKVIQFKFLTGDEATDVHDVIVDDMKKAMSAIGEQVQ